MMEMLLKMNLENGQVGSSLAQICLCGGTLDFGEGGLIVTREQKLVFSPAFPPYYELSIREADGPSVKCSGDLL